MNNEEILNIIFKLKDSLEYEIDDTGIVTVLERQDYKIQKILRKLKVNIPMYKKTKLDEISSVVFAQIDGEKNIKEIGVNLDNKFGDKIHPVYERLLVFLNHIEVNCKYIERINI